MDKILNGYKIVSERDNKYFSAVKTIGEVEYKINVFAKPTKKNGPLSVFGNLNKAKLFLGINNQCDLNLKIFKCKYKESQDNTVWIYEMRFIGVIALKDMPVGTKLASEVKLIKEVL